MTALPLCRVVGLFFRDWQSGRFEHRHHAAALGGSLDGLLQERAVFPEHALARIPDGYSFEEAATLPCAALTAWTALFERGRLQRGQSVNSLASGGHLALIGVLTGFGAPDTSLFPLVAKNADLSGIYVGHADGFAAMTRFIEAQRIRPMIDRVFAFAEAREAYACLSAAGHLAKLW